MRAVDTPSGQLIDSSMAAAPVHVASAEIGPPPAAGNVADPVAPIAPVRVAAAEDVEGGVDDAGVADVEAVGGPADGAAAPEVEDVATEGAAVGAVGPVPAGVRRHDALSGVVATPDDAAGPGSRRAAITGAAASAGGVPVPPDRAPCACRACEDGSTDRVRAAGSPFERPPPAVPGCPGRPGRPAPRCVARVLRDASGWAALAAAGSTDGRLVAEESAATRAIRASVTASTAQARDRGGRSPMAEPARGATSASRHGGSTGRGNDPVRSLRPIPTDISYRQPASCARPVAALARVRPSHAMSAWVARSRRSLRYRRERPVIAESSVSVYPRTRWA